MAIEIWKMKKAITPDCFCRPTYIDAPEKIMGILTCIIAL